VQTNPIAFTVIGIDQAQEHVTQATREMEVYMASPTIQKLFSDIA
jgi:hypothetical protein